MGDNLKRTKIKNRLYFFFAAVCAMFILAACGKAKDPELEAYKESMTKFYDRLTYFDNAINAINPEAEDAKVQLLGYLDEMNAEYQTMAALTIPDAFSGISDIAVESADYMQKADEFYHLAYDNEFDEDSEMLASQYYQRANSRVLVMLQVLHGEVPEGEGVTVETESTYEISTIPTESQVDE